MVGACVRLMYRWLVLSLAGALSGCQLAAGPTSDTSDASDAGDASDSALDTTAPVLSAGAPSGVLAAGTTSATMNVTTDEAATCRWDVADTTFANMSKTFSTTGGTSHSTTLDGLVNGKSYDRYVRCQDAAGNANTSSYTISFRVADAGTLRKNYGHYFATHYSDTVDDVKTLCGKPGVTGVVWRQTWKEIETSQGVYDWHSYDDVLTAISPVHESDVPTVSLRRVEELRQQRCPRTPARPT